MLDAILQLATHLGQRAHGLYDATLPGWCGDSDFFDCARTLQATRSVRTSPAMWNCSGARPR
jgi:hypothetical protein